MADGRYQGGTFTDSEAMTKNEIQELAEQAGLIRTGEGWTEPGRWGMREIESFASLIEAAVIKRLAVGAGETTT